MLVLSSNNMRFKMMIEEDAFSDYLDQLCKSLSMMMNYSPKNAFINALNQSAYTNFFMDNLFLFHHIAFRHNNEYSPRIKILYNTLSNSLYHYTTVSSLNEIISGKSLLLKNLPNLNDTLEGRALIEYITNRSKNQPLPLIKHSMLKPLKLVEEYNSKVFSFSFTTLNDDVSQWERYGVSKTKDDNSQEKNTSEEDPCGVSIEFSAEKLSQFINRNAGESEHLKLHPVLYVADYETTNYWLERSYIHAVAKNSCDNFLRLHNRLYKNLPMNNNDDNGLIKLYSDYSSYIKHTSFKNEREIRLLLDYNDTAFEFINEDKDNQRVFLRITDNCGLKISDLITSITVGPGASDYIPKIKQLLEDNNFKVNFDEFIKKSKCPLRTNDTNSPKRLS